MLRSTLLRAALLLSLSAPALAQTTVTIDAGELRGKVVDEAAGVRAFLGIPYAAPPVGPLRWRPPQPPARWTGTRDATVFSAVAPQTPMIANLSREELPPTSEDCLYLNVWAPSVAPDAGPDDTVGAEAPAPLPVLVYLHGGGLTGGWSYQAIFHPEAFVRHGVVFVSLNYRLGALGYFAHPALAAEDPDGRSGNYGLLDQLAALRWVQRNIAAFGGDPARVTICGESAGATSVMALLASPAAEGLFQAAIAQSAWAPGWVFEPAAEVERHGAEHAPRLLDDADAEVTLAALRAVDADEVVRRLAFGFEVKLALGGELLPLHPEVAFARGAQHAVPLLAGTTADEGSAFLMLLPYRTVKRYREGLVEMFGARADDVFALYPAAAPSDLRNAVHDLLTDAWFVKPTRAMLHGMARVDVPAWQYELTRTSYYAPELGAHHALDLEFMFQRIAPERPRADHDLADAMFGYWLNFVRTHDPNGPGGSALPAWPTFAADEERYLELDAELRVRAALHKERCDALARLTAE